MKKITIMLLALALIVSMAVPAAAVTHSMRPPDLPKVPEIKVEVKLPASFWSDWFAAHPLPSLTPAAVR